MVYYCTHQEPIDAVSAVYFIDDSIMGVTIAWGNLTLQLVDIIACLGMVAWTKNM